MHLRHRGLQRLGAAFHPRLERLENRDCPSCTVFQREETLVILGDEGANQVEIADTREGDIAVTCDGGGTERFAGVQRIVARTFKGDDGITATFTAPSEPALSFRASLGGGDDRLDINWFDPQPDPPSRAVRFDIAAGAGNDDVAFNMGDVTINGQFVMNIDGGAGNDHWTMELGNLMINGEFVMSASGGAGDDDLVVRAILPCVSPEGEARFGLEGGTGDDQLGVLVNGAGNEGGGSAQIVGTLELGMHGGGGNDDAILEIVTLDIRGAVLVDFDGHRGADQLLMQVAADVRVFGLLDVMARGGAGDDILDSFVQPCFLPGGRGRLVFDGESGNDRIAARVETDANSRGALDVRVLGGLGDDDLTLALLGVDELSVLTALLYGGRGHDIARVTRNVRVVNCEEVIFLDDPR